MHLKKSNITHEKSRGIYKLYNILISDSDIDLYTHQTLYQMQLVSAGLGPFAFRTNSSLWHRLNKVLEIFPRDYDRWQHHTVGAHLSAAHLRCKSHVPPHSEGPLL